MKLMTNKKKRRKKKRLLFITITDSVLRYKKNQKNKLDSQAFTHAFTHTIMNPNPVRFKAGGGGGGHSNMYTGINKNTF